MFFNILLTNKQKKIYMFAISQIFNTKIEKGMQKKTVLGLGLLAIITKRILSFWNILTQNNYLMVFLSFGR